MTTKQFFNERAEDRLSCLSSDFGRERRGLQMRAMEGLVALLVLLAVLANY